MPLSAYALAKIVGVTNEQGLAMVLIGCTPGEGWVEEGWSEGTAKYTAVLQT